MQSFRFCIAVSVLIESDWNLKDIADVTTLITPKVLIESDWNLKLADMLGDMIGGRCINGIRLELKLFLESDALCSYFSWRVAHHWSGGYDWSCTGL